MNTTPVRIVSTLLAALAFMVGVTRVEAYPSFDDGAGNGCVSCHPRYFDDPTNPTPYGSLHVAHLTKFGVTRCGLCHQNPAGGDKPVLTYWSAEGFGCAGCHGQDYGEKIPTGLNLSHEGAPKASAYGLRKALQDSFAAQNLPDPCGTCHFAGSPVTGDPSPAPILFAETHAPPYYGRTSNNLTNPCSSSQESWDGTPPGLDNDGNGFADMQDAACAAPSTTTTATSTTSTSTTTTLPGSARWVKVYPGQSIQQAVDAVLPGGTIIIMPGEYQEKHDGLNAVTVSKDRLKIIARSKPKRGIRVVLKPWGTQRNGVVVQPADSGGRVNGFHLKGLTIQGFPNNGILTRYLDNFKIEENETIDNLENGIWPTLSANGLVKHNVSYGSQDAALWVEASENVRVLRNELHHSPTGLEVTVSNNILLEGNDIHDNTAGMGLYHSKGAGLPPLQPPDRNGDWTVIKNHIHDNNQPNSAPPGSLSGQLPPGIGIALIGVDRVNLLDNTIENNQTFGIAISQWCLVAGGCDDTTPPLTGFPDTFPDGNRVVGNSFSHNGYAPVGDFAFLAADMTYVVLDPSHMNCFADNTYSTFQKLGTPTEAKVCR